MLKATPVLLHEPPSADPARAPLLLPDRLGAALARDPVPARWRRLGGLRATAWAHVVYHLGDGRWWDAEVGAWRDGRGKSLTRPPTLADLTRELRTTWVVLATAHRNHDTTDNAGANLAALCQRCHMIHDRPEHRRRRWRTLFRRRAMGDLFRGAYPL